LTSFLVITGLVNSNLLNSGKPEVR
jgi:hypothetical protein